MVTRGRLRARASLCPSRSCDRPVATYAKTKTWIGSSNKDLEENVETGTYYVKKKVTYFTFNRAECYDTALKRKGEYYDGEQFCIQDGKYALTNTWSAKRIS